MDPHNAPQRLAASPWRVPDPGASGSIKTGHLWDAFVALVTAAAESRTLEAPAFLNQFVTLEFLTDGGDATITVKDSAGSTTYTLVMTDATNFVRLQSQLSGSTLVWKVMQNSGVQGVATGVFALDFTRVRTWDALQTNLPATAANDDMAIITGTLGTDAPTLQGVDFGGTSTDEKGAFIFALPDNYVSGAPITVRVRAAMLTAVSDGTATVDVEAYKHDGDGGGATDLCATAAQSINSLTPANKDFTITPTGLVAGDLLTIRLAFAGSDTGNLAVMIPEISKVELRVGIAL